MALDVHEITALAGRPAGALTRRDVARALLQAPAADAVAALPGIRAQLIAAGNPLSAPFFDSAEAILQDIADHRATVGDVAAWLAATGTEPSRIVGMYVWDDEDDRSPLQAEMHRLLVAYLEELLAGGQIDPDRLVAGDAAALLEQQRLQEEWMMSPRPDGRVPMWAVTDEEDEEFLAEWDAAEAEALTELRDNLSDLPERPVPVSELSAACDSVRAALPRPGWPGPLLAACGGVDPSRLPSDDAELWLTVAAGVVSPQDELPRDDDDDDLADVDGYSELTDDEQAMVALCALDHYDWLAVASALAGGGPGTPAGARALARYVRDYDLDDAGDQTDVAAGEFEYAVSLWHVLGAVDSEDRLTRLGWWGIPEAVQRAWVPGSP
jgi:hypothetical protein